MHIFAYQSLSILLVILLGATKVAAASPLPAAHFRLIEAGIAGAESRLKAEPNADLAALETQPEWKHFPYAILAPADLYAKNPPENSHYREGMSAKYYALWASLIHLAGHVFGKDDWFTGAAR